MAHINDDPRSDWAIGGTSERDLKPLLDYAHAHYVSHADSFLRHKDSGIKTLAAVLTAEFGILGLAFSGFAFTRPILSALAIAGLLLLGLITPFLNKLAVQNCTRSYRAALEQAAMVTKIVWAMGLAEQIPISPHAVGDCPFPMDDGLYVPRYLDDARRSDAATTTPL
jgi:hypothetical protein